MNIATLTQGFEAPEQSNLENLVSKINQLVRCLRLPNNQLENQVIANHALDAARETEALVSRLHGRIAELERLAVTDELTGLFNRRGFNIHLQRVLSNANRYEEQGVLVYIDLDGFKAINDSCGHAAGDKVLCQVANTLLDGIRDTDYVGRLGGDEFALLLTRTSWENGLSRAECVENKLNNSIVNWHGRKLAISASLGLQKYGAKDNGLDLISRADEAMYKTKHLRTKLSGNALGKQRAQQ